MQDEKPTLDYGRPDPPRKLLSIDIATSVLLAALGLLGLWGAGRAYAETMGMFASHDKSDQIWPVATSGAIFAIIGAVSLWLAWANLRRR